MDLILDAGLYEVEFLLKCLLYCFYVFPYPMDSDIFFPPLDRYNPIEALKMEPVDCSSPSISICCTRKQAVEVGQVGWMEET